MTTIADLYIRVSTDEQADKGYSQRNQEEVLRKYCLINNIQVKDIFFEDHSAKSFDRPQWKKLLLNLKQSKSKVNFILFTKWDRFSRNAGDAYQMIATLTKLGAEPQAVEQPLDLSIPENKLMLAIYLAAPEVENDRRALNVFYGMRRARKEGRYMGHAPIGYEHFISENGRKYIRPKEPSASILKYAFEELSKNIFNTEQILKLVRRKGINISKNSFWVAIRNPLYCGKIFIPKYKNEDSCLVDGLHEPIISEELFYIVQDILDGRGRNHRPKIITNKEFPLRGFLICPKCGKMLTGSKSRGRNNYYSYYHCYKGCTYRINADKMHQAFEVELKQYIPKPEIKELYKEIILEVFNDHTKNTFLEKRKLLKEINDYTERISHIRNLLSTKQIDVSDYKEMKFNYSSTIERLETRLANVLDSSNNVKDLLDKGIDSFLELYNNYEKGSPEEARQLIGSIYPENFTFDGTRVRTARINEVINNIYLINNKLDQNKKGTNSSFLSLSQRVDPQGFEPRQAAPKTDVLPLHHGSALNCECKYN